MELNICIRCEQRFETELLLVQHLVSKKYNLKQEKEHFDVLGKRLYFSIGSNKFIGNSNQEFSPTGIEDLISYNISTIFDFSDIVENMEKNQSETKSLEDIVEETGKSTTSDTQPRDQVYNAETQNKSTTIPYTYGRIESQPAMKAYQVEYSAIKPGQQRYLIGPSKQVFQQQPSQLYSESVPSPPDLRKRSCTPTMDERLSRECCCAKIQKLEETVAQSTARLEKIINEKNDIMLEAMTKTLKYQRDLFQNYLKREKQSDSILFTVSTLKTLKK